MDDMTEKRVLQECLDKEGVQIDDVTEKRVKEQLDKEGGLNGRHDKEESHRTTWQKRGSKWTT